MPAGDTRPLLPYRVTQGVAKHPWAWSWMGCMGVLEIVVKVVGL